MFIGRRAQALESVLAESGTTRRGERLTFFAPRIVCVRMCVCMRESLIKCVIE